MPEGRRERERERERETEREINRERGQGLKDHLSYLNVSLCSYRSSHGFEEAGPFVYEL